MSHVLSLLLGALCWTLAEYVLHRTWGHRRRAKNPFSKEHLAHHADVMYFAPIRKKVAAAAMVTGVTALPLFSLLDTEGLAASGGFVAMYVTYEVVHRRLHTHPGRTRYGRWIRRHHLLHHYGRPHLNHGVTSPLWDALFGTLEIPGRITVPRRNALPWMVGADGALRPELRGDYVLAGGPSRARSS